MYTPAQACSSLNIDEQAVLNMVNSGRLAAFNIGGQIRFKVRDVLAVASSLALV